MTAQDIRFFQTFTYVLAALVGFTIFIYILAKFVDGNTQDQWVSADPARLAAIEARTAPVGNVALAGDGITVAPTASAALTFRDPPAAHGGDEHHGDDQPHGDGDAEHHDEAVAETHADEAAPDAAAVAEASAPEAEEAVAAVADSGIDGSAIYNQGCNACHAAGVAGAPMVGDAAAWEARVAQGNDTLYAHAINGWNAMPAKGGFTYLSDDQVKAAVDYMVAESQ